MPAYKDKSSGKWYTQFYYRTYEGELKKKKKMGFNLKREAQDWERNFIENQQYQPTIKLGSFIEMYKNDVYKQLRKHTIQSKEYKHKLILPYFENEPISTITSKDIKNWQNKLIEKGYASRYISNIQAELSAIFNHAVNFYGLSKNPCKAAGKVKIPDEMPSEMRFWTLEEYTKAIDHVSNIKAKTAINLLYWTGMRKGELYALTWGDLDLDNKSLTISKSFQRINGEDIITATKTYESRTLLLPDTTIDQILEYKKVCYEPKKTDRIFVWEKTFIEDGVKEAAEKANVERIHLHGFRHSHASYLIQEGVNIVLISKRLGHKNTSMTLDTYSHFYPTNETSLIDIINNTLN